MTGSASEDVPDQPRTLRDQQRELTRRRILDAAHKAFTGRGIASITLDQIARDAEISRATLYLHFSNKEAILLDLLQRDLRSVQSTFESLPQAARGGLAQAREWVRGHADQVRRHRADLNLFSIATATDPDAAELVRSHMVKVAALVLGPDGEAVRQSDPALWTQTLLMIMRINQVVAGVARSDPELDPETAFGATAAEIVAVLGNR